ncbi:hypothetical protein B5S28_g1409 [[Candida] boidinii]|nr:hypothetical protein B5S28_g1409 [[Candida] boidinii]OWB60561.1 hypothetical protein B5S29_g1437 [[Candida] boidinii]
MSEKEETNLNSYAGSTSSDAGQGNKKIAIYSTFTDNFDEVEEDWTPEEEKKATRKVDFLLLPLLFFAFFILQIDRGNIASAITAGLREELKLTNDMINTGTGLFNVGIVVFEIPSNILMQKVGPSKWLSFQVIIWSLVATLQSCISSYSGFLATRFFMGVAEAGFIPCGLYYISTWYTKKEIVPRYSFYFLGNLVGSASSGLIASGIMKNVAGNFGKAGWKWIFIIEGVMGIGYGLIFALLIPDSPIKPKSLFGFNLLNERQSHIIKSKIYADDPIKIDSVEHITWNDLKSTFKQWRIWVHFIFTLSFMQNIQALSTYLPTIVRSLGYSSIAANAMSSIGGWSAIGFLIALTAFSHYFQVRYISVIFVTLWQLSFTVALYCLSKTENSKAKFAVITCVFVSGANGHVLNCSWLSINVKQPLQRSIALAMLVMAANMAGISGGQVLRTNDAPRYTNAFTALIVVSVFTLCVAIVLTIQYLPTKSRNEIKEAYKLVEAEKLKELSQPKRFVYIGDKESENFNQIKADYLKKGYAVQHYEELVAGGEAKYI